MVVINSESDNVVVAGTTSSSSSGSSSSCALNHLRRTLSSPDVTTIITNATTQDYCVISMRTMIES